MKNPLILNASIDYILSAERFEGPLLHRSIHRRFLRNFIKFTGKHVCQGLFFNEVEKLLLIKRLWHRCFPVNFAKFRGTPRDDCFWLQYFNNCRQIFEHKQSFIYPFSFLKFFIFICRLCYLILFVTPRHCWNFWCLVIAIFILLVVIY